MAEMLTERIRNNARELKLLGLAENLDDLIKRAEEGDLGYRRFLDLLLEEEVGVVEGRQVRFQAQALGTALPQDPLGVRCRLPARARPQTPLGVGVLALR